MLDRRLVYQRRDSTRWAMPWTCFQLLFALSHSIRVDLKVSSIKSTGIVRILCLVTYLYQDQLTCCKCVSDLETRPVIWDKHTLETNLDVRELRKGVALVRIHHRTASTCIFSIGSVILRNTPSLACNIFITSCLRWGILLAVEVHYCPRNTITEPPLQRQGKLDSYSNFLYP